MKPLPFIFTILFVGCSFLPVKAYELKRGFDKNEYKELLYVTARAGGDTSFAKGVPKSTQFKLRYRSNPLGLDNLWELWLSEDEKTAVLSVRGTTSKAISWLENIYAAMVPARGKLVLGGGDTFRYELAQDPRAAVHVGWLTGLGFISKEMEPKLKALVDAGVRDVLIIGHSQGGAISYLLMAHLMSLRRQGVLPRDTRIKAYCSAAPKPGNLAFAQEYEYNTQMGWAFNVVNAADWVPEVPFSLQTLHDLNEVNPFNDIESVFKNQKLTHRIVLKRFYNKLSKPSFKAQKNYEKYLGRMASKMVVKNLPGYQSPEYAHTNQYVRTGRIIVLYPDEAYFKVYPNDPKRIFIHHSFQAYLMLLERLEDFR